MKTFIGTVITLIIIIGVVVANSIFISEFADEMIRSAEEMAELPSDKALESALDLQRKLSDNKFFLLLSVNHNEVENIDLKITEILSRARSEDEANYSFAVEALITELEELKKSEQFCLDAII